MPRTAPSDPSAPSRPSRRGRALAAAVLVVLPVAAGAACSDDAPEPKLSAEAKAGKAVVGRLNCQACHSVDGSELVGPSWKDLYGSTVSLKGGGTAVVDDDYVRRAIREPSAERRADATGIMPLFDESRISDAEIDQVIAYLKALSSEVPPTTTTAAPTTTAP